MVVEVGIEEIKITEGSQEKGKQGLTPPILIPFLSFSNVTPSFSWHLATQHQAVSPSFPCPAVA